MTHGFMRFNDITLHHNPNTLHITDINNIDTTFTVSLSPFVTENGNNPTVIEERKNKIRNKLNYIITSDKRDNKFIGTMLKKYFRNNKFGDYCEEINNYCCNIANH